MNSQLSVRGFSITAALVWAAGVFFVGTVQHFQPQYGQAFLELVSSLYPGYHAMTGGKSVLVGTGYALVDGFVCGTVFAWLYNRISGPKN